MILRYDDYPFNDREICASCYSEGGGSAGAGAGTGGGGLSGGQLVLLVEAIATPYVVVRQPAAGSPSGFE
ncbi:MAG: hypothetical protein Q7S58_14810 [Candidatus Binatus sp.]|uniref:hypothetical protein n=1 Tax=Candidatus Binatus sp. TaxID=2811406 RepID=UPI0027165746|nr:hypothetical protein [Candidatus Binatus sp.]MDO8433673.1 hypothetical protein [Candidatus Binatus sp.]